MAPADGFPHQGSWRVRELRGDTGALGAAVTVQLCGHWEHEGPCRWPHHTESTPDGDEVVVHVRFEAPQEDVEKVRERIGEALGRGSLTGPDGATTTWQPVH